MRTFIEAQNPETRLLFRRNNDCVLGRKVIGSLGRSQMYSVFIMLKHFNLRGGKCHFTLYALINRAFPPSAISQFCLRAYPIPAWPVLLQLHIPFINKKDFPSQNLCLNDIVFVSFQFLALGTHFGKVFLLDIQGNQTQKFEIVSTLKFLHWLMCMLAAFQKTFHRCFVQSSLEEKLKVTERWNKIASKD